MGLGVHSYYRLDRVRPIEDIAPDAPRGSAWQGPLELSRTPTHVLVAYRNQLDRMRHDHVSKLFIIYQFANQS